MCAGIVDKNKSRGEIAREEILEECLSEVGTQGSKQIMYYCEVTDDQKKFLGGGTVDEIIDVVEYSVEEAREMIHSNSERQHSKNKEKPINLLIQLQ
uniref:Nudix hydrolase domain-containing protein n=1 Tax=Glossina palpalis gambiensis TaxID=67801 RepID=A0A1B0BHH8_9MUSC